MNPRLKVMQQILQHVREARTFPRLFVLLNRQLAAHRKCVTRRAQRIEV